MAELVQDRCAIKLAVRPMGLYPHRWSFRPSEPAKTACERSPATVEKWLGDERFMIAERESNQEGQ